MRALHFWWRTLVLSTQYNPPEFIELLMTSLTMALLVNWASTQQWPYLVLSSSFAIGAAVSMLVRQAMVPLAHRHLVQLLAIALLIIGVRNLVDVAPFI
ncbi:MAG TPA: hypothetical protein V6C95_13860 [Coleofasciculaceae cyanobacterium]